MENTAKKFGNTAEKIFKKTGNPRGKAVLPLYIVDMLQKCKVDKREPVTVSQLQKMILQEKGIFFHRNSIEFTLSNLHRFCSYITLTHTKVHAVRNHAAAFSIVIKTETNV